MFCTRILIEKPMYGKLLAVFGKQFVNVCTWMSDAIAVIKLLKSFQTWVSRSWLLYRIYRALILRYSLSLIDLSKNFTISRFELCQLRNVKFHTFSTSWICRCLNQLNDYHVLKFLWKQVNLGFITNTKNIMFKWGLCTVFVITLEFHDFEFWVHRVVDPW